LIADGNKIEIVTLKTMAPSVEKLLNTCENGIFCC
jgi:hypothetical protein